MQLSWNGSRYELTVGMMEHKQPKAAGFHWDPLRKLYWTGMHDVAKKFEIFADAKAHFKLHALSQQVEKSRAMDSDIVVPAPQGLAYLPFQRGGIAYCAGKEYAIYGDEMGLGKTVEAIGEINYDPNPIKNILIIPPAGLTLNWEKELLRWMTRDLSGDFATGSKLPNSDIVIMNYEIAYRLKDQIQARHLVKPWDYHIYDEFHYMKNPSARRTQAILGDGTAQSLALFAKKKRWLSGTPFLNRPIELWPTLREADPHGLGCSLYLYGERYCQAYENDMEYKGAKNLESLQERLRSRLMVRRLKKDVLKELPPKRRQIIPLPVGANARKAVQAEMNFYANNQAMIDQAVEKAERAQAVGDSASFNTASKDLKDLKQVAFEEMSKLRHDTGVAKIPYLIQYIESIMEQQQKIVLFIHHEDVNDPILEHFGRIAVQRNGRMNKAAKQLSVDRFMEDCSVRLFIGSITEAVGYTTTIGEYCLIGEEDWRPTVVSQAEDRLHRIGQRGHVLVQHLVFDGSLDARMVKKTVEKQEIIDAALG